MSDADLLRKAEFREVARRFVREEADKRKYRINTDPTGVLVRLLERAYQRGRREEQEGTPEVHLPTTHLQWNLIPPKPRSAFWSICLVVLGDDGEKVRPGQWSLRLYDDRGKLRWFLMEDGDFHDLRSPRSWGERTIRPLIARGLLAEDDPCNISLTEFGCITWRAAVAACNGDSGKLIGTVPPNQWAL